MRPSSFVRGRWVAGMDIFAFAIIIKKKKVVLTILPTTCPLHVSIFGFSHCLRCKTPD